MMYVMATATMMMMMMMTLGSGSIVHTGKIGAIFTKVAYACSATRVGLFSASPIGL